jgi:hypothetical protein
MISLSNLIDSVNLAGFCGTDIALKNLAEGALTNERNELTLQ